MSNKPRRTIDCLLSAESAAGMGHCYSTIQGRCCHECNTIGCKDRCRNSPERCGYAAPIAYIPEVG